MTINVIQRYGARDDGVTTGSIGAAVVTFLFLDRFPTGAEFS